MDPSYYQPKETPSDGIATLGDADTGITCSQLVAREKFPNRTRVGASTFEEAACMVKSGTAKFLLVPGAYPEIRKFLMDEGLALLKVFRKPIPELVYGNVVNDVSAPMEVVYHHAAVNSLLPDVPGHGTGTRFVAARSNEEAYSAMLRHGERAGCVSNKAVFEHYGRPALITLRTQRDMSWHVFTVASAVSAKGGLA